MSDAQLVGVILLAILAFVALFKLMQAYDWIMAAKKWKSACEDFESACAKYKVSVEKYQEICEEQQRLVENLAHQLGRAAEIIAEQSKQIDALSS